MTIERVEKMESISLNKVEAIAAGAGDLALKYFQKITDEHTSLKKDGSLLTIADTEVNAYICRELATAFPHIPILSEENEEKPTGNSMWIVDPIDGTKNFAAGNPYFGISIGLVIEGIPQLGVVHAPALGKLYSGKLNEGAFLNGEPIHVSPQASLDGASVLVDEGVSATTRRMHESISASLVAGGGRCRIAQLCER